MCFLQLPVIQLLLVQWNASIYMHILQYCSRKYCRWRHGSAGPIIKLLSRGRTVTVAPRALVARTGSYKKRVDADSSSCSSAAFPSSSRAYRYWVVNTAAAAWTHLVLVEHRFGRMKTSLSFALLFACAAVAIALPRELLQVKTARSFAISHLPLCLCCIAC